MSQTEIPHCLLNCLILAPAPEVCGERALHLVSRGGGVSVWRSSLHGNLYVCNPKPLSFTLLQVQPFLIGDIVTTVSKGRDAAATTPANDVQARTALNSFAGILLRSAPHITTQTLFHSQPCSLFVCDALFYSLQTTLFGIAGSRMAARLRTQVFPPAPFF